MDAVMTLSATLQTASQIAGPRGCISSPTWPDKSGPLHTDRDVKDDAEGWTYGKPLVGHHHRQTRPYTYPNCTVDQLMFLSPRFRSIAPAVSCCPAYMRGRSPTHQGQSRECNGPSITYPLSMTRAATSSIHRNASQSQSRPVIAQGDLGLYERMGVAEDRQPTYLPWRLNPVTSRLSVGYLLMGERDCGATVAKI
jgi:hypothetical protein